MKRRSFLKGAAAALAGLWAIDPKDLIKEPEAPAEEKAEKTEEPRQHYDTAPTMNPRWDEPSPYYWDGQTRHPPTPPEGEQLPLEIEVDAWGRHTHKGQAIVWYQEDGETIKGAQIVDEDEHYTSEDDWAEWETGE